jgi:ATP-binding cassette subfamily C protein CydCD
MKRLLPIALGRTGTRAMYLLAVLGAIRALALVILAQSLATGLTSLVGHPDALRAAIVWGLVASVMRALASWAVQVVAARAAAGTKRELRARLAERVLAGGSYPVGSTTTLAGHGLDELDKYFATALPALASAATIPLLIGARILLADWISALIIVLTIPLIPVFMTLIGLNTRDRVDAASAALARLSDHLVELARGLPVLVGLGRVEEQTVALTKISDDHRRRTVGTLRTAFLSSLALELISTISVAVVAVFIGLRLVDGSMPLATGLLVLVLVPECFAPFRDLGSAFHAAQDGLSAFRSATAFVEVPTTTDRLAAGDIVTVRGLTVRYPCRGLPAVEGIDFALTPGRITALRGRSGSGKSTVLAALAGVLGDGALTTGTIAGIDATRVAWMPQHPHTVGGTVREELRLYGGSDPRAVELLGRVGLAWAIDTDPAQLSPGELRRLAFVRVLLRVDAGATLVLLDEPTAHLDERSARAVEREILGLRGRVTVLLASHESRLSRLADYGLLLGGSSGMSRERSEQLPPAIGRTASPAPRHPLPLPAPAGSARSVLTGMLRPVGARLALAVFLGVLAAGFAISLTALSAWLIVRAAEHPPIMYLMVAIVGVRFFGIGRSALRYAERLVTHDAVFASATALRVRLWRALASRGPSARRLLRGGTTIDYLVVVVDRIRDLLPRVVLPPAVGLVVGLASVVTVALLYPPAVALLLICLIAGLVVAPAIAVWADRRASRDQAVAVSRITEKFAAMTAASGELRANGVAETVRSDLRALDVEVGRDARKSAWSLGLGDVVTVFACCVTAVLMLGIVTSAAGAGRLPLEVVAVLAFLPLALLDPFAAVVPAAQQAPILIEALRKAAGILPTSATNTRPRTVRELESRAVDGPIAPSVEDLTLHGLSARWPDAPEPAFSGVHAWASRGEWIVVRGPSGSGKSTLLTVLLGYLAPASGTYLVGDSNAMSLDPAVLRSHIAWCPQEAHLFDSTVRANLLLARGREDAPADAEMIAALGRAGLGDLFERLPLGLDTRVGPAGSELSGGERQRLAVARTLLTSADIVLLDEPTAHLDDATSRELMADLRVALADQIVVLVTHDDALALPADQLIELGGNVGARGEALPSGVTPIDLGAVAEAQRDNDERVIPNLGDHAIVADAVSPVAR